MSKSFLFCIVSVALLASCKDNNKNIFRVTGNYKNADKIVRSDSGMKNPGKMVYLEEISFGKDQPPIALDSAKLAGANGSFSLKGTGKPGSIYELIFDENSAPVPLINDAQEISLEIDFGAKEDFYTVKGSDGSKQIQELISTYGKKSALVEQSFAVLDSLKRMGSPDSSLIQATGVKNTAITNLNSYLKNFISNASNPTLGLLAMSWAPQSFSKSEFESSLKALQEKYPENAEINKMKKTYDAQAARQSQMEQEQGNSSWVGKQAPELSLPDINGRNIPLSSFKGKFVLVDFWASWCGPCRNENPNVVKVFQEFRNKNFTILGVSLDKEKEAWKQAIREDQLNWTQVSDLKYWNSKAVDIFQFQGIPFNILVDPQGKIIAQELRGDALENKLKEVLPQASANPAKEQPAKGS
jgi:peroxiredoxin